MPPISKEKENEIALMTSKYAYLGEMLDCLDQSGVWLTGDILPKHERESDTGYARRKASFCYPALYSHMIKTFEILWGNSVSRVDGGDVYEEFINSCGGGLSLDSMMTRALSSALVQGASFLVVDANSTQAASKDKEQGRTIPFLRLVYAHDVERLVVDVNGNIIAFGYRRLDELDELGLSYHSVEYRAGKATVSKDGIKILTVDYAGRIPVVPIVPSMTPLKTATIPPSITQGLYKLQKSIATTYSLIDESLYAQQFSVLTISTNANLDNLSLGTSNALKLNQGDTASFIAPSGTPVDLMQKRIDSSVNMMVKTIANIISSDGAQSGLAKMIDRQTGALMLKGLASYMEVVEYSLYELFCVMAGIAPTASYTVRYYKDFDIADVMTYISAGDSMLSIDLSDEVKKEVRLDLVRRYFAGMPSDDLDKLLMVEAQYSGMPSDEGLDGIN